jgi:hemerythrin superfamily protein
MNALIVLKQDHNNVEELFSRFEHLAADDVATKRHVADKIIEHLAVHAAVEEQVFYPAVRAANEDAEDVVLEGLEEHHVVKWTLSELETLPATDERFAPKMRVLMESVRHHVEEEENDLFPKVRDALTNEQLEEMGEAISRAKATAPVRPHPRQPDTPPLNLLLGLPIAILDRFVQVGKEAVDHVMKRAS